jgi:phosphatidylserine synthase
LQDLSIDYKQYVLLIPFYIISIGALASSTIPTFALKNVHIKREYVWIVMLVFGIVALEIFLHPWYAIPLLSSTYCASIVMSFFAAKKISRQEANHSAQEPNS